MSVKKGVLCKRRLVVVNPRLTHMSIIGTTVRIFKKNTLEVRVKKE